MCNAIELVQGNLVLFIPTFLFVTLTSSEMDIQIITLQAGGDILSIHYRSPKRGRVEKFLKIVHVVWTRFFTIFTENLSLIPMFFNTYIFRIRHVVNLIKLL